MQKICTNAWCKQSFEVTDEDLAFYDRVSPVFAGNKYAIPPPTLCPDCRQQRRLAQCNEFHLYRGECGCCRKKILTQFPPNNGIPYYCRECWHSDRWNPLSFGRTVNFDRPIFEQIAELKRTVPSLALDVQGELINCDYVHFAGSSKNSYLIMHADFCEDCLYGYGFKYDRSCMDGFYNLHSELCYDCVDIHDCYGLTRCQDCVNCSDSAFMRDCIGCRHCFLCTGLRNKEFYFENKQLTKNQYTAAIASFDLRLSSTYASCVTRLEALEHLHTFKAFQGQNVEECSGNYLQNCKQVHNSFDCENVEGGKYCYQIVNGAKNVYDIYQYGLHLQESCDCAIVGQDSYHLLASFGCHISSTDLLCCWYMERCKQCFGCVNMKSGRHCILNKQYTQEEYERMLPQIIDLMRKTGEWIEFFPASISPFGYNKTTAQMYFPLTRNAALQRGFRWDDDEPNPPSATRMIHAVKLPDSSEKIPDDILDWAISCEVTGKPFKIQKAELRFYRDRGLPIPRRSWYQRHLDRFARRNPRKFWKRQCAKCGQDIQTTYAPDRSEIVYCEACYLKEVY